MSFYRAAEQAFSEIDTRKNGRAGMLKFGVDYLDDAMLGILKNDLILIGAGSGAGKTQMCCNIARANVENGKTVHYLALEAEALEIERRIKYQLFAKHFFNDPNRPRIDISFQEWMVGDFIDSCMYYEAASASEFAQKYSGLCTFYRGDKFDQNDLAEKIIEYSIQSDLIILDHVHYMDYEDDNENSAIKQIAKTARSLALSRGKPIILVSHLRKKDRNNNEIAPSLEEFHGSSDLYKIATKAITIGPGSMDDRGNIDTYFRIVKNRFEGSVTKFLGKSIYSSSEGKYAKGYQIGNAYQTRDDGFEALERHLYPKWAKNRS